VIYLNFSVYNTTCSYLINSLHLHKYCLNCFKLIRNDVDAPPVSGGKGLKKEIGLKSLIVIGVSSAVATAIFFSPLEMSAVAGPGSMFAWLLGMFFYIAISITFIELSQNYPEAGGPSRYSIYSHGAVTNLINAMADLVWYLFIPPIEAFATLEGLSFIFPSLLFNGVPTIEGAIVGVLIMLAYIPFNY